MTRSPPEAPLHTRIEISEQEALDRLKNRRARPASGTAKTMSRSLVRVTRDFQKDETPGIAKLQASWKSIVGEKLARVSTPSQISGRKGETILTLEILPAAAPIFQHQAETLRRKLSLQMGGELKAIKLVHKKPDSSRGAQLPILPLAELQALEAALAEIKNQSLSQALLDFGKAVYTKDQVK